MPYNLLLLPICGGYLILIHTYKHKYNYQRLAPQKLLFDSILVGLLLIAIALILRICFHQFFPGAFSKTWNILLSLTIKHISYLWTSVATLVLAAIYSSFCNLCTKKIIKDRELKHIKKAIDKHGDELEKLFKYSVCEGELLQITLKNNKVYIGFSSKIPVPKQSNYFLIIPIKSGYREQSTQKVKFTTYYSEFILYCKSKNIINSTTDISIKKDEIISATPFNLPMHNFFEGQHKQQKTEIAQQEADYEQISRETRNAQQIIIQELLKTIQELLEANQGRQKQ